MAMRDIAVEQEGLADWMLARLRRACSRNAVETRELRVLEVLSLGGRRQLTLVACGAERFLIGGGPDTVQSIVAVSAASSTLRSHTDGEWQ